MVAAYVRKVNILHSLKDSPNVFQAKSLRILDISNNNLDKKSVEYLSSVLVPSVLPTTDAGDESELKDAEDGSLSDQSESEESYGTIPRVSQRILLKSCHLNDVDGPSSLQTLRMDDCNIRAASLDVLGEPEGTAAYLGLIRMLFSSSGAQIRDP